MNNKVTEMAEKFAASVSRRKFFNSVGIFSTAAAVGAVLAGPLKAGGKVAKCCYDGNSCVDGLYRPLIKAVKRESQCTAIPGGIYATFQGTGGTCPAGIETDDGCAPPH